MSAFLIVLTCLVGTSAWLSFARVIAGHLAWKMNENEKARKKSYGYNARELARYDRPDGDKWFGAWAAALVIAPLGPLLIPALLLTQHDRFTVGAEREARVRQREKRVKEIERELGLDR